MLESEQSPSQANGRETWLSSPLPPVIIGAAAFVLYLGTAWFEFVYDDLGQVLDNPYIRSWHYFWSYFNTPVMMITPYYRPLFTVWFRLNYVVFGTHPWGWHLTSVLVHSVAVVMVYLVTRKLSLNSMIAIVSASLFALHPAHIENVAWVSGVCDPLMAVFFCAALLCYLNTFANEHCLRWIALSLFFFVLALLSKEPAVTLPAVIAIHAFLYTEGRPLTKLLASVRHAAPFAALLLPYLWLRHISISSIAPTLNPLGWRSLMLTQPTLFWFYLKELIWPLRLAVFHDVHSVQIPGLANFVLPCLLVLGMLLIVLAWVYFSGSHARLILFATAWLVIVLLPAFYIRSFAVEQTVHDRYLYLPSAGFTILVGLAFYQMLSELPVRMARLVTIVGAPALTVVIAVLNLNQQVYWTNDLALYSRACAMAPNNTIAIGNLARVYTDQHNYALARPMFEEVLRRTPGAWLPEYNLGFINYELQRYPEAEYHLIRSLESYQDDSFPHLYLGLTFMQEGRLGPAEAELRKAVSLRGDRVGHHFALSFLLEQKGDRAGALREARAESAVSPSPAVLRRVQALEAN